MLASNEQLDAIIKLDLKLIEADQVATPDLIFGVTYAVDGIVFDQFGNPVEYHILKEHPGDHGFTRFGLDYDRIPAASRAQKGTNQALDALEELDRRLAGE